MEHLTITRLGEAKKLEGTSKTTGKAYSFSKVGFQCEEHPDTWYDFTFDKSHNLEVGKEYDFELTSREYNGKTYWDAKKPKMEDKVDDKLELVLNHLAGVHIMLNKILAHLKLPTESEGLNPEEEVPF